MQSIEMGSLGADSPYFNFVATGSIDNDAT